MSLNPEGNAGNEEPAAEQYSTLAALFQAGRYAELESEAGALIKRHPNNVFAWKTLGLALQAQGKDALSVMRRAAELEPNDAQAHFNLGGYLQVIGQYDQAVASYLHAVRLKPHYVEAHNNLGNVLKALGKLEEAVASYRNAVQSWPGHAMLHNNLGMALKALGEPEAARESFDRALSIQPDYAEAHNNRGIVLQELGQMEAAVSGYRRALALKPDYVEAYSNLGVALKDLGHLDEAAESFRQALSFRPDCVEAHRYLGAVLHMHGQLEDAATCYRRALELQPDDVEAHAYLGMVCNLMGNLEIARQHFEMALALNPDSVKAHFGLAFNLLMAGEFERGWQEYEWRFKYVTGKPYAEHPCRPGRLLPRPSSYMPVSFAGKRFSVLSDQGIGDELFFLRFAPEIRHRGGWLAYRPSPKLRSLLARNVELDRLVRPDECVEDADYTFLVSELPLVLGMKDCDSLPSPHPLAPLPGQIEQMRERLKMIGNGPYLGVTWWAGTRQGNAGEDRKLSFRQIPREELATALKPWPGQILVLQRNPQPGEIDAFEEALGREVHDFSAANDDLEDMLALLALLDEYVGVSNTNMHLSAGIGKPCRVLVPLTPEWRWMAQKTASPWFPGFKLYRQSVEANWQDALEQLKFDLSNNKP